MRETGSGSQRKPDTHPLEPAYSDARQGLQRDSRHPSFRQGPPHPFIRGSHVRRKTTASGHFEEKPDTHPLEPVYSDARRTSLAHRSELRARWEGREGRGKGRQTPTDLIWRRDPIAATRLVPKAAAATGIGTSGGPETDLRCFRVFFLSTLDTEATVGIFVHYCSCDYYRESAAPAW
jgi:hypothetical protein